MKFFTSISIAFFVSFLFTASSSQAQLNAAFTINGPTNICLGYSISFLDQSTGNPVTWLWDFGDGSISTVPSPVYQYPVPGVFTVSLIVTDGGGNADTATMINYIFVSPPLFVTGTQTNPSCGNANGAITLAVTGGTPPYVYLWSNGANTQNLTNLTAGTYWVSVIDAMGCAGNGQSFVLQNVGTNIALSETHIDAGCGNSNGSIDLTVTSTGNPFTYFWSNTETTEDLNNISAGIYDVTVTETGGCTATQNVIVSNINGPSVSETHSNAICGNSNGSIDITPTGGVSPYSYIWSNSETTEDLSNLSPGNYTVTVTDQNLCVGFQSVTVIDSNVLILSPATQSPSCGNHGNIFANASGGTLPYTYEWSSGSTDNSILNVPAGFYYVTVSEAGGCSSVSFLNATFYFYSYITQVQPNCASNGSLTATAYGGISPYTYLWSNGTTDQTIINLGAGTYTVTITDALGCSTSGYSVLTSTCYNIIQGTVYNDINGNCILDAGEGAVNSVTVSATGSGQTYYGYVDSNGNYSINIGISGTFTITANLWGYGICGNLYVCTATGVVTFTGVGDTSSNNNFGFVGSTGFDLNDHPGWTSANPGFTKEYWVMPFNQSPTAFTGTATATFFYDPNLIYDYSMAPIPVHDAVAHSLTWTVAAVDVPSPSYNWNGRFRNFFTVPASLPTSYLLQSDFYISPTSGDCDSVNNHMHFSEPVTGSHDPNSKEVSPSGNILNSDSVLTYTIHFQNTGNDTTNFVIVKDTLSQYLDPTSVQNLTSSHNYESFDISGIGILTWIFNPIELVDSSTNEPASKGFITFSIKQKSNLPIGTVIENNASIYFDYNSPVVTNTVQNSIINSVKNIIGNTVTVTAYPNPFTESTTIKVDGVKTTFDFQLNNVLGEKVAEQKNISSKQFSFNRKNLAQGIYLYTISSEGKIIANGKIAVE